MGMVRVGVLVLATIASVAVFVSDSASASRDGELPPCPPDVGSPLYRNCYKEGTCVHYAANQFDMHADTLGVTWCRDARYWLDEASKAGFQTSRNWSDRPEGAGWIGSVAVWKGGLHGHVGIVANFGPDWIEVWWTNVGDPCMENGKTSTSKTMGFNDLDKKKIKLVDLAGPTMYGYEFLGFIFPRHVVRPPKAIPRPKQ
jgi:hypothetical protein